MNLEESDKFVEQQRKTEQKKKIVLASIVLCAILVALLIILIIYIQYQDSLKLKMYVDGNQVKITANMLKQDGDTSYVNIAKLIGKKDHTTIIHGVNKIEDELKTNDELAGKIETIKKKICV